MKRKHLSAMMRVRKIRSPLAVLNEYKNIKHVVNVNNDIEMKSEKGEVGDFDISFCIYAELAFYFLKRIFLFSHLGLSLKSLTRNR